MTRNAIAIAVSLALTGCAVISPPPKATKMGAIINGPTHISVGQVMPTYNLVWQNWQAAGLAPLGGFAAVDAARKTVCATIGPPTGITPPAAGDDSITINNAIAVCPAGDVLMLSSGTYQIDQSEYIFLNKGITLRGAGSPTSTCFAEGGSPCWSTVINVRNGALPDWSISTTQAGANCGVSASSFSGCSAAQGVILMSPSSTYTWGWAGCNIGSPTNPTTAPCGTTLTADAAQGATTVNVASTTGLSVGMWTLIDESPQVVSTVNPTGGAAIEASPEFLTAGITGAGAVALIEGGDIPGAYSFIGSGGGAQQNQRLNEELHQITAINGNTLTFSTPLTLAFRQSGSHDARVYWPSTNTTTPNPFLSEPAVENLTITKAANGAIQCQFGAYCIVHGVEVGGWIAGAVNLIYAARFDVEFNFFHDCYDCENNGAEYPLGISSASTEGLVADNIIVRGGKGMVGRGASVNVIAYNYVDDTFYMQAVIGDYWHDMDLNGSHYAGTHHWIFEGNLGDNCDGDETHGNATYHVFFRNQCTANRATFVDPSNGRTVNDVAGIGYGQGGGASPPPTAPGPQRAIGPMAFDYRFAYVGNVLGLSGVTTTANGWVYRGAFSGGGGGGALAQNKALIMSGWTGGEWPAPDPNLTGKTNLWTFQHGNFDYVNNAIVDWQANYSQTLPNSFFLANGMPPTWWPTTTACSPFPFPWVTPTASSQIQVNKCGVTALPAYARYKAGTPFVNP